jgi:hypothetical protein
MQLAEESFLSFSLEQQSTVHYLNNMRHGQKPSAQPQVKLSLLRSYILKPCTSVVMYGMYFICRYDPSLKSTTTGIRHLQGQHMWTKYKSKLGTQLEKDSGFV